MRLTEEQRAELEAAMRADHGPRALGAWLVWRARGGTACADGGSAQAALALPELGHCPGDRAGTASSSGQCRDRAVPRRRGSADLGERLILDLCGGSGSWSRPYAEAGYRVELVTLPTDVRTFCPPPNVWGILAAPPCDQFSLARNGHDSPRDLLGGLEVVSACMRIVAVARPRWWALENPVGLLSHYLGTPRDVWQPHDFGDPWTKRTAIWGDFIIPTRGPFVQPLGGGPLCEECDPSRRRTTWCSNASHRARTPQGFARAFCRANP